MTPSPLPFPSADPRFRYIVYFFLPRLACHRVGLGPSHTLCNDFQAPPANETLLSASTRLVTHRSSYPLRIRISSIFFGFTSRTRRWKGHRFRYRCCPLVSALPLRFAASTTAVLDISLFCMYRHTFYAYACQWAIPFVRLGIFYISHHSHSLDHPSCSRPQASCTKQTKKTPHRVSLHRPTYISYSLKKRETHTDRKKETYRPHYAACNPPSHQILSHAYRKSYACRPDGASLDT